MHAVAAVAVASERDRRMHDHEGIEDRRPAPQRRRRKIGNELVERKERRARRRIRDGELADGEAKLERIELDGLDRRLATERGG